MPADAFQKREQGEEAHFKLDLEIRFKAEARRNRLLGQWAGDKMGLDEAARAEYAREVIAADLEEPGYEDVIRKVTKDFEKNDIPLGEDDVRAEIIRLGPIALAEVNKEVS
ncbi:MAG: DUF1476 domain-containing protein [Rhodospirillaceae bacterium]|jgi:hypothetical protein